MSDSYNETFLHRWCEEVWNKGRAEAIDEMAAKDVIAYGLKDAEGNSVEGIVEFKQFYESFRSAFPDIHIDIEETVAEGDKLAAVCRVTATHRGDGINIPPTGKEVDFSGILMVRLRDGKISEAWNYFDFMTLFGQLEVLSLNLQQDK